MALSHVPVSLGDRSYEVVIGEGLLGELREFLESEKPTSILLVTDRNVGEHHVHGVQNAVVANVVLEVPPGEHSKSLEQLGKLYDQAFATRELDRTSMVVALGGGMVGDLAGFLAATLLRGVRHVHLPTSLLAMVDSSVGGKTAINHSTGKNLIGAFHQPVGVFCDLRMLDTLPEREYVSALAEIVKTALLAGPEFVEFLEGAAQALLDRDATVLREVVERCVRFKAEVVAEDERETSGRRATLNLGHTLAHVLETEFSGRFLHGEAVSIGIVAALRLSFARAELGPDAVVRVRSLLAKFGLPVDVPDELDPDRMLEVMSSDKKRHGDVVHFVVVSELGQAGTLPCRLDERLAEILLGHE
jgi:3-dehydroquinate synthase